jgi:kynurenine formamidase
MQYVDLTHLFSNAMPVYPGDPVPELAQVADIGKDGYTDHQVKTTVHVGTHIDGPLHMVAGAKKLCDMAPDKFFGRGRIIDVRGRVVIDEDVLSRASLEKDDVVLLLTGFSRKYDTPEYYESHPELAENFARSIIEAGIKIIGLDSPSPDRPPFPIHKLLLESEVLLIENLTNLEALIGENNFEIFALPIKLDADSAPARVIARIA